METSLTFNGYNIVLSQSITCTSSCLGTQTWNQQLRVDVPGNIVIFKESWTPNFEGWVGCGTISARVDTLIHKRKFKVRVCPTTPVCNFGMFAACYLHQLHLHYHAHSWFNSQGLTGIISAQVAANTLPFFEAILGFRPCVYRPTWNLHIEHNLNLDSILILSLKA